MIQSIKRLAEMNRRAKTACEEEYDEEGRLKVHLTVRSDANFLSPFSSDTCPSLSTEVADFLDGNVRPKQYKKNLHIIFHSDEIDDTEKPLYTQAVKKHYFQRFVSERQKIRRDAVVALIMLITGILTLGLMILLDNLHIGGIALEIFDIVAWVFLWEAADIFFLQRHISQWLQHRNIGFINAEITFLPLDATAKEACAAK